MDTDQADSPDREQRLDEVVAEYLRAVESGAPPPREVILARHPNLAPELKSFFDDQDHTNVCVARAREEVARDGFPPEGPLPHAKSTGSNTNGMVGGDTTVDDAGSQPGHEPAGEPALPRMIGKFEVVGEVGQGSFCTVLKGRHSQLPLIVAIKIPREGRLYTEEDRQRFLRDGRNAARLRHPAIVEVIDVGQTDGVPFLVQPFVPGPTLAQVLREERHYTPEEAARLLATVADALQYAHEQGVVHRDVKPSNILLGEDGTPYLTDFGLALFEADPTITSDGQVLGTVAYMSPEQAAGQSHRVDGRADVYSLGVVLYLLLTGELPFRGNRRMVLYQVLHEEPRTPRSLNDAVPRDLETICLRAMAKFPDRRFASAREMANDLRRFLAAKPIHARPVGKVERLGLWCRRNPALAAATSGAMLALVAVGAVSGAWVVRERDHALAFQKTQYEAEYRLAENSFDHGLALCEGGDAGVGLLWLARSMEKSPAGADQLRETMRTQFTGWGRHVLRLDACFDNSVPITAAAMSPDGRTVWAAGEDLMLRRWDIASRRLLGPPLAHAATAQLIAWSPDGAAVLTVGGGKAQRWNAVTGERLGEPVPHEQVRATAWSPDVGYFVTGSRDGKVRLWDAATGHARGPGFDLQGTVQALAVSPDGCTILTGGADSARLWNVATGTTLGGPLPHLKPVVAVAFSPDGRTIMTASEDKFHRWDVATRSPLGSFRHVSSTVGLASGPERGATSIRALTFSPDGRALLVRGSDRSARLYDPATGQPVGQPFPHRATVRAAAFSADGRKILTADSVGSVRLWEADLDRSLGLTLRHDSHVRTAVFSPDGRTVLTASFDNTVRVWDAATGNPVGEPFIHPDPVMSAAYSPDGRSILTECWSKDVWLWDVASRQSIMLKHPVRVNRAVFSPDGRMVLTGAHDGSVRFWNAATGTQRCVFNVHRGPVMAAAFSPDGRTALTGSEDGAARLWDVESAKPRKEILPHDGPIITAAFSRDGQTLVTGSYDHTARLWDVTTGRPRDLVLRHNDKVSVVAFSPDGRTVLTACNDGTALLWDINVHSSDVRPLIRPDRVIAVGFDNVWAVAFSPDGRTVLTGSLDGSARMWDVATGKSLGPPLVHGGGVRAVAFSPDGRTVLTGSEEHTARLWRMPAPAAGTPEQVTLQAEVFTGLALDDNDVRRVLDSASWHDRRERLKELGGTLRP